MKTVSLLMALLWTLPLFGSQVGILPVSSVRYESAGLGSSGKVVVEIKQDSAGRFSSIHVSAFGKEQELSKKNLGELDGFLCNGLTACYEIGYEETGGPTVYLTLVKGFFGQPVEKALISIASNGAVSYTHLTLPTKRIV